MQRVCRKGSGYRWISPLIYTGIRRLLSSRWVCFTMIQLIDWLRGIHRKKCSLAIFRVTKAPLAPCLLQNNFMEIKKFLHALDEVLRQQYAVPFHCSTFLPFLPRKTSAADEICWVQLPNFYFLTWKNLPVITSLAVKGLCHQKMTVKNHQRWGFPRGSAISWKGLVSLVSPQRGVAMPCTAWPSGSLKLYRCSSVTKKRSSSILASASPGQTLFPVNQSKKK